MRQPELRQFEVHRFFRVSYLQNNFQITNYFLFHKLFLKFPQVKIEFLGNQILEISLPSAKLSPK